MPERPIIMSAESVRALLRETDPKSQTRKVIKPSKGWDALGGFTGDNVDWQRATKIVPFRNGAGFKNEAWWTALNEQGYAISHLRCPYPVGTRLWVKETLNVVDCPGSFGPHYLYAEEAEKYHAITGDEYMAGTSWAHLQGDDFWDGRSCGFRFGVRSPLYMPRCASRITLEVTDVRVQRLWDISEEDAVAEGVRQRSRLPGLEPQQGPCSECGRCYREHPAGNCWQTGFHNITWKGEFAHTWNEINAKRGHPWSQNDWVWALTFRRIYA